MYVSLVSCVSATSAINDNATIEAVYLIGGELGRGEIDIVLLFVVILIMTILSSLCLRLYSSSTGGCAVVYEAVNRTTHEVISFYSVSCCV